MRLLVMAFFLQSYVEVSLENFVDVPTTAGWKDEYIDYNYADFNMTGPPYSVSSFENIGKNYLAMKNGSNVVVGSIFHPFKTKVKSFKVMKRLKSLGKALNPFFLLEKPPSQYIKDDNIENQNFDLPLTKANDKVLPPSPKGRSSKIEINEPFTYYKVPHNQMVVACRDCGQELFNSETQLQDFVPTSFSGSNSFDGIEKMQGHHSPFISVSFVSAPLRIPDDEYYQFYQISPIIVNSYEKQPLTNNPQYFVYNLPPSIIQQKQKATYFLHNSRKKRSYVILQPKTRLKRQSRLAKLGLNPATKLDIPKTLENVGNVVRNSFENQEAPLYHVKNAVSSAKDALMSTLKIAPQDLIVPSKYKIVDAINQQRLNSEETINDAESDTGQEDTLPENHSTYFFDTYQKIGNMLRDSIRSAQDALAHLGEVAFNTRKAFGATRNIAPKWVHPDTNLHPILERLSTNQTRSKLLLVTPKILELKHDSEVVGAPHYLQNKDAFVSIGHVFDSLGISNPAVQNVGLIQRTIYPRVRENLLKSTGNYLVQTNGMQEKNSRNIQDTINELENAKKVFNATSLKDLLWKIKNNSPNAFKQKLEEAKARLKIRALSKTGKQAKPNFNINKPLSLLRQKQFEQNHSKIENRSETSHAGAIASQQKEQPIAPPEASSQENEIDEVETVNRPVGAINPIMFKKIFNESLESAQPLGMSNLQTETKLNSNINESCKYSKDGLVGASMIMGKNLLTPFMGKIKQEVVDVYLDNDENRFDKNAYLGKKHDA